MNRYVKVAGITIVIFVAIVWTVCGIGIFWFKGKAQELELQRHAKSHGTYEAMVIFNKGYRWKYIIDGERDERTRLNREEEGLEVFAVYYKPSLGSMHEKATGWYVDAFNSKTQAMLKWEQKEGPNKPGLEESATPPSSP